MSKTDLKPDLWGWFVVTLVIGLAPFWVSAVLHYAVDDSMRLQNALRFGSLIFYGYALALQVMKERWGEQKRLRARATSPIDILAPDTIAVPIVVFFLSALSFWRVLGISDPGKPVISFQVAASFLAIGSSFQHRLWVRRILRESVESRRINLGDDIEDGGPFGDR